MKPDSIAIGIAGVVFGLLAGWVIGSNQKVEPVATPPPQAATAPSAAAPAPQAATVLDEAKVTAFKTMADREPQNATPRVQLGNLYFDAERYADAITWYAAALALAPNDVDVSTDLGVSYYYTNQPDKALEQFAGSLRLNPTHAKTLLNVGVVRAFGKQDLAGAEEAWQKVVQLTPDSPEGQAAKRALDTLRSAHQGGGTAPPAPRPGA
jgi:tetratricopeptide (TPR) repeat protein